MKVVAFLPVKGTSERVESKNTKLICDKPLFMWSLEKLRNLHNFGVIEWFVT